MYWSFDKIPELAGKSAAERAAIVKLVSSRAMKHWEWWAALLFACLTTGVGAWYGGAGITGPVGAGIGGAIGGAVHHVVVIYIARRYHSALLHATSAA